jgi:5-methylthioadenosine/S-adenosylhomocysteine deaminase
MRLFAGVNKEISMNPRVVPPETVIEMATINGARCVGLDRRLGSVEVGKLADLTLFDTRVPEWQPLYNPLSNLVYSATGNSVVDVFVGGDRVVRDGHLSKVSEDQILADVESAAKRIGIDLHIEEFAKPAWPVV